MQPLRGPARLARGRPAFPFPWANLAINLVGSALLGAVVAAALTRGLSPDLTVVLGVGFIGAFTTFSTFSVETVAMVCDGRAGSALLLEPACVPRTGLPAASG